MPAPPSELTVNTHTDRSLVLSWKHPEPGACIFHVKVEYFDPTTPMIEPEETKTITCSGLAFHFGARDDPKKSEAFTARVSLEAACEDDPEKRSNVVTAQITMDDALSVEEGRADLEKRVAQLSVELDAFGKARGRQMCVLVVGPNHHGKSSFINHVYRCFAKNLEVNDQLDTAPAGSAENTQETLTVNMDGLCLIDTPALPNMSTDAVDALQALLAGAVSDGARRRDFTKRQCYFQEPPHAAILLLTYAYFGTG